MGIAFLHSEGKICTAHLQVAHSNFTHSRCSKNCNANTHGSKSIAVYETDHCHLHPYPKECNNKNTTNISCPTSANLTIPPQKNFLNGVICKLHKSKEHYFNKLCKAYNRYEQYFYTVCKLYHNNKLFQQSANLTIRKKLISMTSAKFTVFENNNVSIILRIRVDIGWHVQHIWKSQW